VISMVRSEGIRGVNEKDSQKEQQISICGAAAKTIYHLFKDSLSLI
jgi:hypothetical protein